MMDMKDDDDGLFRPLYVLLLQGDRNDFLNLNRQVTIHENIHTLVSNYYLKSTSNMKLWSYLILKMHFSFIECKLYCSDAQHLNLNDTKSQLFFTFDANDYSRLFLFIWYDTSNYKVIFFCCFIKKWMYDILIEWYGLKFVFIYETYSVLNP